MSRILDVYLHNVFAGTLIQTDSGGLSYRYHHAYISQEYPALSISLPLQIKAYEGDVVRAFFSGLLPDSIVRHKLAQYLGVSEKNPFAMLEVIGGECAGALALFPEGVQPQVPIEDDVEVLDDHNLKEILELLRRRPMLAGEHGFRISLAGAQDKIAVGLKDGKIALIKGTHPTTHILKPLIEDIKDSVHNELFCMRLAKLVGIEAPEVEIRFADDTPYYLIERYDRLIEKDGQVRRIHQEDFCQALGIMPEIKYEREGGPTFNQCMDILKNHSLQPAADQISMLNSVIFNYLIGNADAHGKNFSLLYRNKKPQFSPVYDLMSTAVYPDITNNMAMKIGGRYKSEDVFLRHWHRLVPDTKASKKVLEKQLLTMSKVCLDKANELKVSLENEGIHSNVFEEICFVITKRAERIQKQID